MQNLGIDAGLGPDGRIVAGRARLGMPGPVWTMALWFAVVCVLLGGSLLVPLDADARPALRAGLMIYAGSVAVLLIVLGQRTAGWFIHAQVGVGIVASLALVYASGTPVGAITSSNTLIVVAAYVGFWMPRRLALYYVGAFTAGLLAVFGIGANLPELLVPWAFLSALSFGIVLSFGALVRQMKRQLVTDPLTGLLNRSGMFALVEHGPGPGRMATPRCLVVIDLDRFKHINDRRGHLAGDRILRDFGDALRAVTRPQDIAIRSGGDEFVLLLPGTDLHGGEALARRLRAQLPLEWSYGIVEWAVGEDFDAAWARADAQMYRHKAGRAASPLRQEQP